MDREELDACLSQLLGSNMQLVLLKDSSTYERLRAHLRGQCSVSCFCVIFRIIIIIIVIVICNSVVVHFHAPYFFRVACGAVTVVFLFSLVTISCVCY